MFLFLTLLSVALTASVFVSGQLNFPFFSSSDEYVHIKIRKDSTGAAVTGGILGTIMLGPIGGIISAGIYIYIYMYIVFAVSRNVYTLAYAYSICKTEIY